ncbi:MAG: DUF559 domain-containing protein, partial [Mesorhizobium sp.]
GGGGGAICQSRSLTGSSCSLRNGFRAAMTDEERILWRHLWRIPVEGTHFRKQASVGIYFPDFMSRQLKLIIEVDGAHHSFDDQQRHDEVRTKRFETQGYRVIRFWNHEVKKRTGFRA